MAKQVRSLSTGALQRGLARRRSALVNSDWEQSLVLKVFV